MTCCTSNVNPPARFHGNDRIKESIDFESTQSESFGFEPRVIQLSWFSLTPARLRKSRRGLSLRSK